MFGDVAAGRGGEACQLPQLSSSNSNQQLCDEDGEDDEAVRLLAVCPYLAVRRHVLSEARCDAVVPPRRMSFSPAWGFWSLCTFE